jgi:hypothetical protein
MLLDNKFDIYFKIYYKIVLKALPKFKNTVVAGALSKKVSSDSG